MYIFLLLFPLAFSCFLFVRFSWGLYQSAGMESGGFHDWASRPMKSAQVVFDALAVQVGCKSKNKSSSYLADADADAEIVACMRGLGAQQLLLCGDSYGGNITGCANSRGILPLNDTWDR
jgi:hypothetical protein